MNSTAKALVELPRRTVAELLRAVNATAQPDEAADTLRAIGAGTAGSLGLSLRDQIGAADASELPADQFWRELGLLFESLGWGSIRQEDLHPGVFAIVSPDWFEAEQNHHAHPCCHFSTGLFAALLQELAGSEIAAMEVECRGAGDTDCRFLLGSPEALDELYEGLSRGTSYHDAIAALS